MAGSKRVASQQQAGRKKRKTKGRERVLSENNLSSGTGDEETQQASRRSCRSTRLPTASYDLEGDGGFEGSDDAESDAMDVDASPDYVPPTKPEGPVVKQEQEPVTMHAVTFTIQDEEDESKEKPDMRLSYQGFSIFGKCLCVSVSMHQK